MTCAYEESCSPVKLTEQCLKMQPHAGHAGLHKGNIMHGALSLHQLAFARPMNGYARHRTPLDGLYICGAGMRMD
jgi:phytoene dehydrogenase-like protein